MPADAFIAEIFMGGMNFAPRGFATCSGQILSIAQNTALFSLLGTTFGGNGQTTFALPDLRGRVPVGEGQGPGLPSKNLGEIGGTETHTLTTNEMPAHNHLLLGANVAGDVSNPNAAILANSGALDKEYKAGPYTPQVAMHNTAIANTGGSQPHNNMPPYLVLTFYIAVEGIFPSRN